MLVVKLITRNFMFLSNGLYLSDTFLIMAMLKKLFIMAMGDSLKPLICKNNCIPLPKLIR